MSAESTPPSTPPPSPSKLAENAVLPHAPKRQRGNDDDDYKSYTLNREFVPEEFVPEVFDPRPEQLSPRGHPNTSSVTPPGTPTKPTKRA